MTPAERPKGEWPAWVDDVLLFGPIAELEDGWRGAIGDAITDVLDRRKRGEVERICPCCGLPKRVTA